MQNKAPIFIVDGSSFLYRAYYAMRPLQTSKGVPVQAVYGFCKMIKKLIKSFDVQHLVIVWDSKGKTTRHEYFPEYKANRQAPPSDLFEQKELILKFADLLQIKQVAQPGIEADDLIFSLAQQFSTTSHKVIVVSSDKDLAQMVTEKIEIFDPFKEKVMSQQDFEDKFEFEIAKLPFYFALLGDSSDNIPGVKGIGKKGATTLVQQFDSLEHMYENLDTIEKKRTKQLLADGKDNAFLSLKLFTLQNYPVDLSTEQTGIDEANWQHTLPLFQELEFKSFIKELALDVPSQQIMFHVKEKPLHELYTFHTITTEEELIKLCKKVQNAQKFAIDTETTGLDPMQTTCVGLSICYEEGNAYYIPFKHNVDETQLDLAIIQKHLNPIFSDTTIHKIMHNAKFDQIVLHQAGLPIAQAQFDTLIAASLLVPDWQKKGLKNLSEFCFQETMLTYETIVSKHLAENFSHVPLAAATTYAAADAHQTFKLYNLFAQELQEKILEKLFFEIEMPTSNLLTQMQLYGIYCNTDILDELNQAVSKDLEHIQTTIEETSGCSINLNSPKQVKELLFETLGLPPQKKSAKKTGYSTDAEVLHALSKLHPVPKMLLKYRELFKLKSTYIESLPAYINPQTDKIHTTFNQTFVATGRLSSSNPNLQNVPVGNLGYKYSIRQAFQADEGRTFIAADYSQIELRILAYFSQDKHLVEAFLNNHDIHTQTAMRLFELPAEKITSHERSIGKKINFSILYGLTPYGLSKDLEISFKDAQYYIEMYFAQYPGIKEWMHTVVESTKEKGYTQTFFGRMRQVPAIHERNKNLYEMAKRIAINTPVQGTAAEIMKVGMVNLNKAFDQQGIDAKILLQIHDELIISAANQDVEKAQKAIKATLESVVDWNIPLTVQMQAGKTWQDVTK